MAIQIAFICRQCGQTSNLPTSSLADYYASENEEFLVCLECRPIRVRSTLIPKRASKAIITHLSKQVDRWTRASKERRVKNGLC